MSMQMPLVVFHQIYKLINYVNRSKTNKDKELTTKTPTDFMQETEQVNEISLDPWENPTLIKFVQTGLFPETVSKS
jgi:hypothetical protein